MDVTRCLSLLFPMALLLCCAKTHAVLVPPTVYDGVYTVTCEDGLLEVDVTLTGKGIDVRQQQSIDIVCTDDPEESSAFEDTLSTLKEELSDNCSKVNLVPALILCDKVADGLILQIRRLNAAFLNVIPNYIVYKSIEPGAWWWRLNIGMLQGQEIWSDGFFNPLQTGNRNYVFHSGQGYFIHSSVKLDSMLIGVVNCATTDAVSIRGRLLREDRKGAEMHLPDMAAGLASEQKLDCVATINAIDWFYAKVGLNFKWDLIGNRGI